MAYTDITNRTSPNQTAGRGGKRVTGITIHWWGDPKSKPTAEGVVNWLCNPASQVSAHYVATGTGRRVWCLVATGNTAWHAGNWNANLTQIGIECDPRARAADYDVIAELIADIWKYYGKLPLYPHKHWVSTTCPGNYNLNKLKSLAESKLNPKSKFDTVKATKQITAAYEKYLGRKPDAGGLKTYLAQMQKGWSIAKVESALKSSAEYKARQKRLAQQAAAEKAAAAKKAAAEAKAKADAEAKAKAAAKAEAEAQKKADELQEANAENMANAIAENNSLLNKLVELVTQILNKIMEIFK